MNEYTIEAKPTKYNGRVYRSRLEARWACFFDLCGWEFEYEPFDLNGWTPDFILHGRTLIEIKPSKEFFEHEKYDPFRGKYYIELLTANFKDSDYMNAGFYDKDDNEVWYEDLWVEAGNKVMFLNPVK